MAVYEQGLDPKRPEGIIDHFQRRLRAWAPICTQFHTKVEANEKFMGYSTEQWPEGDRLRNQNRNLPSLAINMIAPVVELVTGTEITGRLRAKPFPLHPANAGFCEVLEEAMRHMDERSMAELEETRAFRSQFAHGLGCIQTSFEMEDEDGQQYTKAAVPLYEMVWDPTARKSNLRDRMGQMHGYWISHDHLREQYPDAAERILNNEELKGSTPIGYGWTSVVQQNLWNNTDANATFCVRYEWKERKTIWVTRMIAEDFMAQVAQAVMGGQLPVEQIPAILQQAPRTEKRLDKDEWKQYAALYQKMLGAALPSEDWKRRRTWCYYYALIVGSEVVENDEIPTRRFMFDFFTGVPVDLPARTDWTGLVDRMRDGQEWSNRIMLLALIMGAAAVKGFWLLDEALGPQKVAEFENKAAVPGATLTLPSRFFDPSRPGYKFEPPQPSGLSAFQGLLELAQESSLTGVGMNRATLGQIPDLKRVSGVVVTSVTQSANLQLATYMDSVRTGRIEGGKQALTILLRYFDEEGLAKIVGMNAWDVIEGQIDPTTGEPMPPQYVPKVPPKDQWAAIGDFEVKIDESPAGTTALTEFFQLLMEHGLAQFMMQSGWLPPEIFIQLIPANFVAGSIKNEWLQKLTAMQAAQQQQPAPAEGGA